MECDIGHHAWRFVSGKRCMAKKLAVTIFNVTITSINGKAGNTYHNEDIKILSIHMQTLHYLPSGIEKLLPNIEALSIVGTKLKSICKSDLEPFRNLQELYLQQGELDTLSSDLFEANLELRSVSFRTNRLQFIGQNLLAPLRKLELANFELNKCVNKNASNPDDVKALAAMMNKKCSFPREFMELAAKYKKLQAENQELHSQLKLLEANREFSSRSQISDASEDVLKELQHQMLENMKQVARYRQLETKQAACSSNLEASLKNLFIANQKLKTCDNPNAEFVFTAHEMLKIDLTCETNHADLCEAVDFNVKSSNATLDKVRDQNGEVIKCEKLSNLTRLSVVDQQTLFLPSNIAEHFTQLSELAVKHSGLFEIDPRNFRNMRKLTCLKLSENFIQEVPAGVFGDLLSLLNLDLSHNNIANVENGAFKGLAKLKILKLSDNSLTSLNSRAFDGLAAIEELSLRNNKLAFVDILFVSLMPNLDILDMTNNECVNAIFPKDPIAQIVTNITSECVAPIEINCSFTEEQIFTVQNLATESYKCKAENLKIVHSKTNIVKVNGAHYSGSDSHNVTAFVVIDQIMNFLPNDLSQIFPQIETILVVRSKLMSLQKQNFQGFSKLKSVTLRFNSLSFIDGEAFDGVERILYIDLSNNQIQQIPSGLFSRLSHLTTLILSGNFLKELNENMLVVKNMITEFKADDNKITQIDPKVIKYLRHATIIDLSLNICIDMRYEKGKLGGSRNLEDLLNKIDNSCSLDA